MTTRRYILEKYKTGGSNRYACPSCGRKKCFTRYIDTQTGRYVADNCGKCNHENSCGYNYTPRDYFLDHPNARENYRGTAESRTPFEESLTSIRNAPIGTIPFQLVEHSQSTNNMLCKYLLTIPWIDVQKLREVAKLYHIGSTHKEEIIYWQIDVEGRVRAGKIMQYTPNGHRTGYCDWVHSRMKKLKQLADSWQLRQCLFGEHLLHDKPEATVCLVESEKSAIICAMRWPQYVWVATGGSCGLTPEKLKPLHGHRVVVFPDSGEYERWRQQLLKCGEISFSITPQMEQYGGNTDIADILLQPP